jgi:penicillin amidase
MRRLILVVVLVAVAGAASAQTMSPASSGVVPVVSRTPGAMGSTWSTNVYITQVTGNAPATVNLTVHAAGGTRSLPVVLPGAGGSAEVLDVVSAAGVAADGNYVMTWWSTQPVVLSTRTFTTEAGGSYGQGITSVADGSGFATGGTVIFPAPMDAGSHRVNVGIANAGPLAQGFHIEAIGVDGSVGSTWDLEVGPYAVEQLRTNAGMSTAGSVSVSCVANCDRNAFGYASVVVNDSNDAYFLYAGADEGAILYPPVLTIRDETGVWFITGGSLYDVFEAFGHAVATDRLWQMEQYRRAATGRLAEILGLDYLSQDVLARTTGYSAAELEQQFESLDGEAKTIVTGYLDGVNRRIAEVVADTGLLPFEFKAIGAQLGRPFVPEPWTAGDVLAWVALMQRNFDPEALEMGQVENGVLLQSLAAAYPTDYQTMFSDLRWINDPAAQTMIPPNAPKRARTLPAPDPAAFPDLAVAARNLRSRLDDRIDKLERINARVKMGSYAWVVSGDKTDSGRPTIYSGPQMGFPVPSIVLEGSIRGGGLAISGMTTPGIPGIIIGRTPHHAWSMQVGHAHSLDYYLESPTNVRLHRLETIKVAGIPDQTLPVYRSPRGPIVEPIPYNPQSPPPVILSWAYAHWEHELLPEFILASARARSMDEFGAALDLLGVSQHFCYADADGNIAYWMSGWDPIRPPGVDPRLPLLGDGSQDWTGEYRARAHDRNTSQGFYGGWNNKASADYDNPPQSWWYQNGPAHRAHVITEYLSVHDGLSFEQVRDLALNIATTDSFGGGGNTWSFVADDFTAAVQGDPTPEREAALAMLEGWDGHFVAGGEDEWVAGTLRADAWVLQDAWIRELLRLIFADEFAGAGLDWQDQPPSLLFNVLLHALAGDQASLPTRYDWFQDRSGSGLPTTADELIVLALDNTLAGLGPTPWDVDRGVISYNHEMLGTVHTTPLSSRSTYAHVVEFGGQGPLRIESMFPLGQSGTILMDNQGAPVFDENFFSMAPHYDAFAPRDFPLFE